MTFLPIFWAKSTPTSPPLLRVCRRLKGLAVDESLELCRPLPNRYRRDKRKLMRDNHHHLSETLTLMTALFLSPTMIFKKAKRFL